MSETTGKQGEIVTPRSIESSPVIRFHIRNALGIFLVLLGLVASTIVVMTLDFQKQGIRENAELETDFKDIVVYLDTVLSQVTAGLDAMRSLAEADLDATRGKTKISMPPAAGLFRQSRGYFNLDGLAGSPKLPTAGNLTGLGEFGEKSLDELREIRAALVLNPLFSSVHGSIKTSAWIYYLSAGSFINIYPWVPSTQWKIDSQSYEKDFFQLSLPRVNPGRKMYWTPVYPDEVGKGMMTTSGVPVYDGDRYLGTVAIDLPVDFLNRIVTAFRPGQGTLFLVNTQSQILAHPEIASSADSTIKSLSSALPEALGKGLPDILQRPGFKVIEAQGYIMVRASLENAPWQAVYLDKIAPVQQRIMDRVGPEPLVLFGVLFFMVVGILVANHTLLVRPSDRFARYILQLNKGRFDKKPGRVPAMWEPLFRTIEQIFQENHTLTDEIRQYNEKLEDRVARRTMELVRLNRTLNQEIIERERAQNAEKEMSIILDQAVSASPSGIIIADAMDLSIQRVNQAAFDIRGDRDINPFQTDIQSYFCSWELFDPQGRRCEGNVLPLHRAVRKGEVIRNQELTFKDKQGKDRWLSVNAAPVRDAKGQVLSGIVIFHDISSLKEREMALYRNEQQYRRLKDLYKQLSDASFEAIFLSKNGICIGQNRTAENMFGYSLEEALGLPGTDWIASDSRELVGRMMAQNYAGHYEAVAQRKDGSQFPCEIQARITGTGNARIRVTALRDITARKQAEKERQEAQNFAAAQSKHALVGQVAGKMAHDFNNILGVIMGNAELALADCGDRDMADTLELILGQTLRGKNLTRNLVAFARDQEPKQERFSINKRIDLVTKLLKKDLVGIRVTREFQDHLPDLIADPGMIEHMLVNLFINAVHALGKNPDPEIFVRTFVRGAVLGFEIRDNGCGIPEDYLDKIYEPSFTLKGTRDLLGQYLPGIRGTGYGMANVKKYLEQHKGRIQVQSVQGEGTCFIVELPVVDRALSNEEEQLVSSRGVAPGRKILLVEDETAISQIQYSALTHPPCSHQVDIAENGKDALELFRSKSYDLVSLDYVLPGEFNGIDVYHRIREQDKDVPIVFVSGNIEFLESIKNLKSEDPQIDHLSKPCLNHLYIMAIQNLLAGISGEANPKA